MGRFEPGHPFAASGGLAAAANRAEELETRLVALGPLTDIPSAKERVEVISDCVMRGLMSGSQGNAAVRAVEIFLRCLDAETDRAYLREVEEKMHRLETELAKARGR